MKPIDPVFAALGIEYKYSVVSGNAVVAEDGVADLKYSSGLSVIKVEAVDGDKVVRRAYVKINVNYIEPEIPGVYFNATAYASVVASRIAFEVTDIPAWAEALKNEPNTLQILKQVAVIVKEMGEIAQSDEADIQKAYLIFEKATEAYTLLNGVPGFVKKYQTFSGYGEAEVKAEFIPEIMDVATLKAVLEMIEEEYPDANFVANFAELIETYVPESWKDNLLVAWVLDILRGFSLSDILENESIVNALEWAQDVVGGFDFAAINDRIEEVMKNMVGEGSYGETAARITAEAKARAAAEAELKAAIAISNEKLMANFTNGTWGKVYEFFNVDLNIENEYVLQILEHFEVLDDVQAITAVVEEIRTRAEDLVKYTYESDDITYETTVNRREVK